MLHSSFSRHTAVLFHRSTEQNPQTSLAYLYSFEQIGADFSCAFGSGVVYVLEFGHGALQAFSMCLTVETETSVPAAIKSYCRPFAVS